MRLPAEEPRADVAAAVERLDLAVQLASATVKRPRDTPALLALLTDSPADVPLPGWLKPSRTPAWATVTLIRRLLTGKAAPRKSPPVDREACRRRGEEAQQRWLTRWSRLPAGCLR